MKGKIKRKTFVITIAVLIELATILSCWIWISYGWRSRYDKDKFNYVDMSYACGNFFKSIGIPTQVVYGHNNNSGHCWLLLFGCIEFESVTLYPKFWNKNADKYHIDKIENI